MVIVRPRTDSSGLVTQRALIDLEHDGTVDFVVESERFVHEPAMAPSAMTDRDAIRKPTLEEHQLFTEICQNPTLPSTLAIDGFDNYLEWLRSPA